MSPSPTERSSPYKGLTPYSEGDASFFFGREKDTRLIIANLFASPLTLLYGASGVGKSSVLRAGVAHQLRQRDDLIVVPFSAWQGDALGGLLRAISDNAQLPDSAKSKMVVADLKSADPSAETLLARPSLTKYLQACHEKLQRRFMIILDQFEEYFLYHPEDDAFAQEFPRAVLQTKVPVSFLISIREDSLAKLDRFEGHIPCLFENYLRIEHLNRAAAREAIEKPIDQYNSERKNVALQVSIDPNLVTEVLKQVETGRVIIGEAGRGMLKKEALGGPTEEAADEDEQGTTSEARIETPFLQMVMTRLWKEELGSGSRVLRLETLAALGDEKTGETGAERIVRTHLDDTMNALSSERQDIAAKVFHYLVTPSGTKIAHKTKDLAYYAGLPQAQLTPALEELTRGDTRILRGVASPTGEEDEQRYEIFHDVLAAAILDWRARYMQTRELAGQQLKLAAERKRINRLRLALAGAVGVALLIVLAAVLALYAYRQKVIADQQRAFADNQAALAAARLKILTEAANELDPVKARAIVQKGAGVIPLTEDQERRKEEKVTQAIKVGHPLVRTPPQYGLNLWANGATLRIKFLDGKPDDWEFIKQTIAEWGQYANLHFDYVTKGEAEIRISLKDAASYSYMGTDALGIDQGEPTLVLGIIAVGLGAPEKKRYVLHEFGHALGLIHEINNPNANIPWDRKAAYDYFERIGWSREMVNEQILDKYQNIEYRPFDPKSIMIYPVPKALTGGKLDLESPPLELSDSDKEFIGKLYPRTN